MIIISHALELPRASKYTNTPTMNTVFINISLIHHSYVWLTPSEDNDALSRMKASLVYIPLEKMQSARIYNQDISYERQIN